MAKIAGLLDDFPNRKELNLSDEGFSRAVDAASIQNIQGMSTNETRKLHTMQDRLDAIKRELVQRIMYLARKNMTGIQLQAFLLAFQMDVNKCEISRMYKVSRQSIQIRNKRAIRKLKKLLYEDINCIRMVAEMQYLRKHISEMD